jgi:hypothetical protein
MQAAIATPSPVGPRVSEILVAFADAQRLDTALAAVTPRVRAWVPLVAGEPDRPDSVVPTHAWRPGTRTDYTRPAVGKSAARRCSVNR